jgi:putative ABC transport system substrate-binding protein
MRRREFIAGLGSAAAWPVVARAQQPAMPVIGFLNGGSPGGYAPYVAAFRQGLKEIGYVEGRNLAIEYRWAEGRYDRLPELAADLVSRKVAAIAANGVAAQAAKAASATIPVIFVAGFDPVAVGLVASLSRPEANVTGVSILDVELGPKRLELLHELVPTATKIAVLVNPKDSARADFISREMQAAAAALGLQLHILNASNDSDLEAAFTGCVQLGAGGLVIGGEPFFNSRTELLGALSIRHAVPAIYQFRTFAAAGGLVSYGTGLVEPYRLVGAYTGRVLKGEKPGDLPVQLATKVEMIINLKTAKALGLSVPLDLTGRADELIE